MIDFYQFFKKQIIQVFVLSKFKRLIKIWIIKKIWGKKRLMSRVILLKNLSIKTLTDVI